MNKETPLSEEQILENERQLHNQEGNTHGIEGLPLLDKTVLNKILSIRRLIMFGVLIGVLSVSIAQRSNKNTGLSEFFSQSKNLEPPQNKRTPPRAIYRQHQKKIKFAVAEIKPRSKTSKNTKVEETKAPKVSPFDAKYFPESYMDLVKEWEEIFDCSNPKNETCLIKDIEQAIKRGGPHLKQAKIIFKEHGVPEDLVYLIFIESLWQHDIKSHVGAYGLAQFLKSTAEIDMKMIMEDKVAYCRKNTTYQLDPKFEDFSSPNSSSLTTNLEDNTFQEVKKTKEYDGDIYAYDQRRDYSVIAKMAEYLSRVQRYCSNRGGESWVFAAFAYNAGMGYVSRILDLEVDESDSTATKISKFLIKLQEYENTENYYYVVKLIAMMRVIKKVEAKHPELFIKKRMATMTHEIPPTIKTVILEEGMTVSGIAAIHGVYLSSVLELNELELDSCSSLGIGTEIKVSVPQTESKLYPGKLRKALGLSVKQFYSLNPGILSPEVVVTEREDSSGEMETEKDSCDPAKHKSQKDILANEAKLPAVPNNWPINVPPNLTEKAKAYITNLYKSRGNK